MIGISCNESTSALIALTSNLGTRYAPAEPCATPRRLPALGAAIDAALAPWLEGNP